MYDDGYAMNSISDKWQFTRQPVLTKVSSLLNSLGYSTCFSWNPHTLAVNSLDSFLGVANRESRPLRWRGFLHLVPTVLQIDAFCTNSGCVTVVVLDKFCGNTSKQKWTFLLHGSKMLKFFLFKLCIWLLLLLQ